MLSPFEMLLGCRGCSVLLLSKKLVLSAKRDPHVRRFIRRTERGVEIDAEVVRDGIRTAEEE